MNDDTDKNASPARGRDERTSSGSGPDRPRRFAFAMRALSRTPVTLAYQNRDLYYEWVENLPNGLDDEQVLGATDSDFLPRLAAERMRASKLRVIETREPMRFELPVNLGGQVRWFDIWLDPDMDGGGPPSGVYSTIIDVTSQKRREVQLKNLLREVSHRSRNLLAIVLSLASQTARSATSLPGFVGAFSGRLHAIARAQDLVTDRDWQGALLSDLVSRQIALFHRETGLPVAIRGDDLVISPTAALYVGLAIHELAAHAIRNGQMAAGEGAIVVDFNLEPRPNEGRTLVVRWSERLEGAEGGAEIEPLARKFLESVVPLAVDGKGTLEVTPTRVGYELHIEGSHIA